MKFGKEFASQMVQEWQEAYMDYNFLKSMLKDMLRLRQKNRSTSPMAATPKGTMKRRASLYRAFSGLTGGFRGPTKEDEVILVSSVKEEEGSEGINQTMFLMASEEGGEHGVVFFRKLDVEFNKVLKFYKNKVEEVMSEADELTRQMKTLIALRIKVDRIGLGGAAADVINLAPNEASSYSPSASVVHPLNCRKPGWSQMEVIQEVEMSSEDQEDKRSNNIQRYRPPSLEVLEHVKINVAPETPVSTLKGILMSSTSNLSFSKEEMRKAEARLTQAFIEFYQKLRLLKSYCFLNQLAFAKIMKKHDKITSRNASKVYLNMVDNSYLGSSDEITKLMERVEATFTTHFFNGNHRKGMNTLRPQAKREKHRITFFLGFCFGCTLALLVTFVVLIHARDILNSPGRGQYMDNIFPLYSLFVFNVLHMLMYAANIYFWKRFRVNYSFIFGFKKGTELGYREVLLLSSGLAVLTLAAVISNLDMEMEPKTKKFRAFTELVPLGLVIVVLLITFCPFNIIYRSSRFFLITCAFHSFCAPLYKVTLPDFFLADQLTSQVQAFRSLQFYVCYYGWGDFKRRSNNCSASKVFDAFHFIVAIIPYWFRFLQCLRRLFEERGAMHGLNGLKYFSTIIAVATRTSYELNKGNTWKIVAAATSGLATIVNTYWDIAIDWGLLRRGSKNPWLRDKLLIPNTSVYFVAIVLNVLLRLAWMQTVLDFTETPFLHRRAFIAVVACLEILRRGIWNFFRLENEHLNNVGRYRAFKSVPLPFNYDEDEGKNA